VAGVVAAADVAATASAARLDRDKQTLAKAAPRAAFVVPGADEIGAKAAQTRHGRAGIVAAEGGGS
jgi:hypothetical protein